MNHVRGEEVARWVAGVLEDDAARALEDHVRGCEACSALLATEARVEVQLQAAMALAPRAGPWRKARVLGVLVPLALAASLAALLVPTTSSRSGQDAGVSDDVGAPVQVVRYERDDEVPPEALSAFEPQDL